ncbi:MAG: proteasome assembly chaperone family protein [Candidatus Hydrothermarchaeales archaeon]
MEEFNLYIIEEPELESPTLVEGLPGIGNVGKIATMHLIEELKAKKFATLYSPMFPPQVVVRDSGIIEAMKNEFFYWKAKTDSQRDLIFVIGNTQSATSKGQYALTERILDIATGYGTKFIYTLGGLGVGRLIESPKVFGAVTDKKYMGELEKLGVVLRRVGVGQIIGVSGLLLGLGKIRGIDGVCLMGETSGYYLDPNSAKAVLGVLTKLLHIEVNMDRLDRRAIDTERMVAEAQAMERKMLQEMGVVQKEPSEDEMRYIG